MTEKVRGKRYSYFYEKGMWVLKRSDKSPEDEKKDGRKWHAHFNNEGGCKKALWFIKHNKMPHKGWFQKSLKRVLPEEEYENLRTKEKYINVQKGARR